MLRSYVIRCVPFVVVACIGVLAFAQSGLVIEPDPNQGVYRVSVQNEMGFPARVKIMGHRHDAHFVADLDEGASTTQNFYGGDRVVCVWDPQRRLSLAAMMTFDRPGRLVLRPVAYATVTKGVTQQTTKAYEALPSLSIE